MRAVAIFFACVAAAGCSFHVAGLDGGDPNDLAAFLLDGGAARDLGHAPRDLASAAPRDLTPPPDLAGPFLHVTSAPPTATIDLTKEGTVDWAHWGYTIASDFDRKATGGDQISNYTLVNALTASQYGNSAIAYKWNDGQSGIGQRANSMGPTTTGIFVSGTGNGVRLTAPADQQPRHLRLYVGGYKVTGQVHVALSDGTAPMFADNSYGSATTDFNVVYDIRYEAGSPNQTLELSWTLLGGDLFGNVTLQAATLQAP